MKTLQHYVQDAQTKLFDETGTLFAFSNEQFSEKRKEGVIYVALGVGIFCPKSNVDVLKVGLKHINNTGIVLDIAENGKEAIIKRELYNHEAFYTGDMALEQAQAMMDAISQP